MGCCISRIKDKKNSPFEEEESSENPLGIVNIRGYSALKNGHTPNLIPKKKKIFERLDETLSSKYKTSLGGTHMEMDEYSEEWDSCFFHDLDVNWEREKAPKSFQ
jgi:hypothetical protein